MDIKTEINGNEIRVSPVGMLNNSSSPDFIRQMNGLDTENSTLVIDFLQVPYITSAGLRALLILRKRLSQERLKLINVNADTAHILDISGFGSILSYELCDKEHLGLNDNYVTLLRERAADMAGRTAYRWHDRAYSWSDIDMASQIIASDLWELGVRKGTRVGICSPNSINWVFVFFAIQKLGAIAVCIGSGLKPSEIRSFCEISDTAVVCYGEVPGITDYAAVSEAIMSDGTVAHTIDISSRVDYTRRYGECPLLAGRFTETYFVDDPGIIIFTSGSSGKPKAVLLSPYACLSHADRVKQKYRVTAGDINCAVLPFFHVFGLCMGIGICLLTDMVSCISPGKKPEHILQTIENNGCTVMGAVPTMLLNMKQNPAFDPAGLASLRCVLFAGAPIAAYQLAGLQEQLPHIRFAILYGMSENLTISLTEYDEVPEKLASTVGRPAGNIEVEIHEIGTDRRLAVNESGEVCVRSDSMIVCYYKAPLDSQPVDIDGWLHTGDLGFLDPEGYLHITGRIKELIIRGGENIAPNEVAAAVAKLEEIADVKVLGVPHEIWGEEVAAAITLKPGAVFNPQSRSILKKHIANFKVPRYFVAFDRFPLLGSGKPDSGEIKKQVLQAIEKKEYL